jgi:hypothetical protein
MNPRLLSHGSNHASASRSHFPPRWEHVFPLSPRVPLRACSSLPLFLTVCPNSITGLIRHLQCAPTSPHDRTAPCHEDTAPYAKGRRLHHEILRLIISSRRGEMHFCRSNPRGSNYVTNRSSHMPLPSFCNPGWSMLAIQSLTRPMCSSSSISRDSSVGRASDRRSEGPRFDPGSRHLLACSLRVLSKARICRSSWVAPIMLSIALDSFLAG